MEYPCYPYLSNSSTVGTPTYRVYRLYDTEHVQFVDVSEVDNGWRTWAVYFSSRDKGCSKFFITSPVPINNNNKKIRPTYDKIAVKTVSKCLVRMKGCWDPEFEPGTEEIVDCR